MQFMSKMQSSQLSFGERRSRAPPHVGYARRGIELVTDEKADHQRCSARLARDLKQSRTGVVWLHAVLMHSYTNSTRHLLPQA